MAAIMDTLHDDHRNTRRLLRVVERQRNLVANGDDPDYDLLEELVEYFLAYPDMFHHPKEDAIYERLQSRSPEVAAELGDLRDQHLGLQQLTRSLGDAVRGMQGEFFVPREQVAEMIRDFVDGYRDHIDWEEARFFPAAERSLTAGDWERLDRDLESARDPLFGHQTKDQYVAIRNDILRADEGG